MLSQRILRYFNHNHQNALDHWKEWVIWRHTLKIDEVTDEDIQHEVLNELRTIQTPQCFHIEQQCMHSIDLCGLLVFYSHND